MQRKVFRAGNSLVVSIPREAAEFLGLNAGSRVSVELDREQRQIVIAPALVEPATIDAEFARHVGSFIERYRPALEALAR